jgi:hypothetical protein
MYPYQIWSHHTWLKGRDHQLKRTKLGSDLHQFFYLTSIAAGGQDFTTYQLNLTSPYDPTQHASEPLVAMPGGYQYRASDLRASVLEY